MSDINKTEKTTIEDVRKYWSHERAVSGHKAAFAGATLIAVGYLSAINIDDAKEYVDSSDADSKSGYVISYGGKAHEHTFSSVSLIGLSFLSVVGGIGGLVRAGDRYARSAQHRSGDKDHQYDPRSYDV